MRIGVLGGGRLGSGLAAAWRAAGHEVVLSTRETVRETAAGAEVVVLAVPAAAVEEVVAAVAGPLDGKVLVDATNDLRPERGGGAVELAARLPSARVVKAFNTVFAALYEPPARGEAPAAQVFCGDDEGAKQLVARLIADLGFEPVDAGGLERAPEVEAFARLVIGLAYAQGRGPFVYRFSER